MSALAHRARRPATPVPFSPQLRARIENAIEHLVLLLDAIDGDPDLEDGADTEPNCGGGYTSARDDEAECEDEGDVLDLGEGDEAEWQSGGAMRDTVVASDAGKAMIGSLGNSLRNEKSAAAC